MIKPEKSLLTKLNMPFSSEGYEQTGLKTMLLRIICLEFNILNIILGIFTNIIEVGN
jgi:hypothetical protein